MGTKLVIGSNGQLGSVLVHQLKINHGESQVVAADIQTDPSYKGMFEQLDANDFDRLKQVVVEHEVEEIYHLAAILSAKGEEFPLKAWDINMKTFFNVLEVSRLCGVEKVFFPSSIAVFGSQVQRTNAKQNAPVNPSTVYGISKVAGENWSNYYFDKYGLDVRSLRYPGVIGYQSMPGGGTTDYAVDIFHHAVADKPFNCFLEKDTSLPMIYMEDAIRATIELMNAPLDQIHTRTSYNLSGMSFSPEELFNTIQRKYPNFKINYCPDFRQKIANSWPEDIDDAEARADWGWEPKFDLEMMTETMVEHLAEQIEVRDKKMVNI